MTKNFCDRCGRAIDIDKEKAQCVQASFVAMPPLNALLCELCYPGLVEYATVALRKACRVPAPPRRSR